MRIGLAIQPFGDEAVKGWFLHRKHIDSVYQTVQPTVEFVNLCNRLICVMTSRISIQALRPCSVHALFLEEFPAYLDQWENKAKPARGGFPAKNTAVRIRATIKSTLGLLTTSATL